jgi:uncharacterized protein YkwD
MRPVASRVLPALAALLLAGCASSTRLPSPQFLAEGQARKPQSANRELAARPVPSTNSRVAGAVERTPLPDLASPAALAPVGPEALDLVNDLRLRQGLQPLSISRELTRAAQLHAEDLARQGQLSHFGSDRSTPLDRVRRAGYRPRMAAENIAGGQATIAEAIRSWRESDGHNRNLLLPDATQMGVALAQDPRGGGRSYWTLVLGAPL